jgi:hypothetical protein
MKYKVLFTLLLNFYGFTINAQTGEDSVKQTITTMFTAMKNADAKLLLSTFADSAILQTIAKDRQGKVKVMSESVTEFAEFVGKQTPGKADERITIGAVLVDGDLASVWTPYQFYFDGKFSHCGANSFQLVRINNEWKIQYLVDTRRKNCREK